MNKEPKPIKPKTRDDLIREILKSANVLSGSAEANFGNDDDIVPDTRYNRIQSAQSSLNLAVTALRLQLSPHLASKKIEQSNSDSLEDVPCQTPDNTELKQHQLSA